MDNLQIGNLTIEFLEGGNRPQLDNNILTIYSYALNYEDYTKVDLYLDEYIVQVAVSRRERYGAFEYKTNFYVLDMGVWNWRTFKDISVIKHLERLNVNRIPKNERHILELDFGRTEQGSKALSSLEELLKAEFHILDNDASVKIRSWDHSNELFLTILKTKIKIKTSTEQLERIVDILFSQGFEAESWYLKGQLLKTLVEVCELSIDLKEHFKKTKSKIKKSSQ